MCRRAVKKKKQKCGEDVEVEKLHPGEPCEEEETERAELCRDPSLGLKGKNKREPGISQEQGRGEGELLG